MKGEQLTIATEYSEFGHRGERERDRTFRLVVVDENHGTAGHLALEVECDERSFPDNGDHTVAVEERVEISSRDLIALIRQHGRRVRT